MAGSNVTYNNPQSRSGIKLEPLMQLIISNTHFVMQKLSQIQHNTSSVSIGDMFEMQMLMNHLAQVSEMSTAIISAANTAVKDMAQNVRG